ncbi:MAG: asparaginase domain-containing protein [Candidatus Saccharibacteria bacterium]
MINTRLIITGGTIDKRYNPLSGELVFAKTHIPEMLGKARFTGETVLQELFLKDSLDITEDERDQIVDACISSEEDRIVITHGTDTMIDTAQLISRTKQIGKKTIVLTGSMIPYSMGEGQDALFNLGTALAYAQALDPGVYVAMNGQAFEPNNVIKDRTVGLFLAVK